MSAREMPEDSIVKFLITSDNHLGYMERDPRRQDDSFVTFEECLMGAQQYDVDAMLIGGDLFHENKPSLWTMNRAISLFKRYVLGSKDISLELLSDPAVNFPTHPNPWANFQDPNMNIALPIFCIHGNHDDPIFSVSAINVLSSAGLMNYFGNTPDLEQIIVRPILLRKGETRVALFGFGNIGDERLHRCFRLGKVSFVWPKTDAQKYFSILILHQNRGIRAGFSKAGVTEDMLAPWNFDLVIWGNEHEQLMDPPQRINGCSTEIIQPGSTVMTSLSAAESNPKKFGILSVCGTQYKIEANRLCSTRPVVRRTIELAKENLPSGKGRVPKSLPDVEEFLRGIADQMVEDADKMVASIPPEWLARHPYLKFPLLRLAVDYQDPDGAYPRPNESRFGNQYLDVAVNPSDILKPIKPTGIRAARVMVPGQAEPEAIPAIITSDLRSQIEQVLLANARDSCVVLSELHVTSSVSTFVNKSEANAISVKIGKLIEGCQRWVYRGMPHEALSEARIVELARENKAAIGKEPPECEVRHIEAEDLVQRAIAPIGAENNVPLGKPLPKSSHAPPPPAAANRRNFVDLDDSDEEQRQDVSPVSEAQIEAAAAAPAGPAPDTKAKTSRKRTRTAPPPKSRSTKAPRQEGPRLDLHTDTNASASAAAKLVGKWARN